MKKTAAIFLLCALFLPILFFGQGETSNWYFGNGAGITFNPDGSVTAVTDGKLDTFEGCASISDSFGDLLFYTDGIVVYDQDHQIMENGTGLFGDPSSTQSALIVPKPGDESIYFIFTVDTSAFEDDPDRGLNYSTVDISQNNGMGSVVEKNISLLPDCSEKIAAVVKDCSDQSIWLLTFASSDGTSSIFNTFHAYEINKTGVQTNSVKTTFSNLNIEDPRGYIKLSPNGSKLASANMQDGLYLYDFDAVTGKLVNQEKVFISGSHKAPYGLEFSPNSQYLYVHTSNDLFAESGHRSSLLQYDILSSNVSESQEIIDTRSTYRGALQLGDNGKIYRTTARNYFEGNPFLSVIHNPNQKGDAANYEHEAISLNGKKATQGLPPFIQSFFNKIALIKNQDGTKSSSIAICAQEAVTLEADLIPGATYSWEKDGVSISNSGNILEIISSTEADSGKYRLTILTNDPKECPIVGEASIEVVPLPMTNMLLLEQCDVDENSSDGITAIDLEQVSNGKELIFTFYETLEDQINKNNIANPEAYENTQAFDQTVFYDVTNKLGCTASGEIALKVNQTIIDTSEISPFMGCNENEPGMLLEASFDLDALQQLFTNQEVAFYENSTDAALENNPVNGILKTSNITLYARIENENQCLTIETIDLVVNAIPEISLNDSYQVCSDGNPIIIEAPSGFDSYTWYRTDTSQLQVAGTGPQITITKGGDYRLEAGLSFNTSSQSLECKAAEDFNVTVSNRASFDEIIIQDLSENNSINILVSGDGEYEYSLDGQIYQNAPLFENIEPGFYTVFARDLKGCGVTEKEIVVVGYPKFFTPNGDGFNDTWQLTGAGKNLLEGQVTIFDRYGRLLRQLDVEDEGWNGTYNGKALPASDYWFKIALVGGKEFKGHFALKR